MRSILRGCGLFSSGTEITQRPARDWQPTTTDVKSSIRGRTMWLHTHAKLCALQTQEHHPRRAAPRHTGPLAPWDPVEAYGKAGYSVWQSERKCLKEKQQLPFSFFSQCSRVCPCLSVTCVFYFCSTFPPTLCLCPSLLAQIFSMAKASNIITMVYFPLFII